MGVRFRKSVKICKGVRVNFSKSGASLSLGGRGHRVTTGGRGTRMTFGIPGTGLSYTTKVGGSSHKRKSSSSRHHSTSHKTTTHTSTKSNSGYWSNGSWNPPQKQYTPTTSEFDIHMNENGKITILDSSGREITDPSLLRRIKQTPQFILLKNQLDIERRNKIDEMVKASEEENDRFINIYKLSPVVDSKEDFDNSLNTMKPEVYIPPQFMLPMPTEQDVRDQLTQEAQDSITGSIFSVGKQRKQYVEDNLQKRYALAMTDWENKRNNFLQFQEQKRIEAEKYYQEEYEDRKEFLEYLINGDDEEVSEMFDSWIESCELPVEINIDYDWNNQSKTMMLDVDLPEIEDIAETRMVKTDSGGLKEKKKTQAELKAEYATLVFGLAVFISANVFNISPAIQKILISGYTQRRNKDGDINDDYIYSIKFTRSMFEKKNVALADPKALCMSAENRCNMTTTSLFKVIKPYDSYE
ncbi:MAG: DUF4236 domain-containing protein [Lachnospiraceae bacterium]|nr:DUF4236 domain-containing protein [Lachnospiraceae bacterium]